MTSIRAKRPHKGLDGAARSPTIELQDVRRLITAAEAVRVFPFAGLSTAGANGGPGVSRKAFEDHLAGREACLLEAFEQALALAAERASAAFQAQEGWTDRVRAGVLALLEFFDEEPALARFLVVHSAQAGPAVQARRSEVLDRLARIIDDERAVASADPAPLMAQAALSGVLGVVHGRLSTPNPGPVIGLAGRLMSFLVLPFLGAGPAPQSNGISDLPPDLGDAPAPERSVALDLMMRSGGPLGDRAIAILRVIGAEPGLTATGQGPDRANFPARGLVFIGFGGVGGRRRRIPQRPGATLAGGQSENPRGRLEQPDGTGRGWTTAAPQHPAFRHTSSSQQAFFDNFISGCAGLARC